MMAVPEPKAPEPLDERATIAACRRGERAALGTVFRRHGPALERLLRRLVGPHGEAEDLLQDTFEAAIDALPRFGAQAPVAIWLSRIAVHVAYDHLRRPERKRRVMLELVGDPPLDEPTPERRLDSRSALVRIHHHLAALSPKKRIAFLLHVVEQRPIAEVAALMSATRAATKTRIWLARRALLARARRDPTLTDLLCLEESSS
jgi:RNA polymerase sigma-70 factor (ECF subfamily)